MKSLEHIIRDVHEGRGHDAVTQFAAAAHEEWRKGFDPEGSGKERIKKNSDGTEGNINVPFHKLHPDWQRENLEAGKAALVAVRKHPKNIEKAAEHVHNEWMKRNPKADWNASQHVSYSQLPEEEKEKDRVHVRKMHAILGKPIQENLCVEHVIRNVLESKRKIRETKLDDIESTKATRAGRFDTKMTESDLNYMGSGTGGEPKMHAEDGKKKKTDEAVGSIGTDDYKGNQPFRATPHIKPPAGPGSHSQAPEKASRQRTLAKERTSMTMHGKVSEQAVPAIRLAAPVIGAGVTAGLGAAAAGKTAGEVLKAGVKGGVQKIQKFGSYFDKLINPPAEELEKAKEKIKTSEFGVTKPVETPPKVKPKHDEPVPAGPGEATPVKEPIGVPKPKIPDASPGKEKVKPPKPDIGQPEPTKAPDVPRKQPTEIPTEPPAKAVPAPETPKVPELPPPYRVQPQQPAKEKEKAPAETPKRWREVGPPMPAETRPKEEPAKAPVKLPDITIPGTKVQPAVAPDTKVKPETETKPDTKVQPDTKTKPETKVEPRVVQLPAIDIGARTKTATDTKVAPATVTAPAAVETPAATTPKSAETTTTPKDKDFKFPGFPGLPSAIDLAKWYEAALKNPFRKGLAKKHRSFSEQIERKEIENVPRKGDRRSISYVGRKDDDPKTTREKTSRQAATRIKLNVVDENRKLAGIVLSTVKDKKQQMKAKTEDGLGQSSKNIQYPNGTVVSINPELSRTTMDIDGKLPNDYK